MKRHLPTGSAPGSLTALILTPDTPIIAAWVQVKGIVVETNDYLVYHMWSTELDFVVKLEPILICLQTGGPGEGRIEVAEIVIGRRAEQIRRLRLLH
jgi:hypothetical protein